MRFWRTENFRIIHQRNFHIVKVTVWCGVNVESVLGPYFFEDKAGSALTKGNEAKINGER